MGYIPEGLTPLCIRGNEGAPPWLGRWRATHLPLGRRIDRLLALAHVSPDELERQAAAAGDRFDAREHVTPPPAASPAVGLAALTTGRPAPTGVAAAVSPTPAAAAAVASRAATTMTPATPHAAAVATSAVCPSCAHPLRVADYEGVRIEVCPECGVRLVASEEVRRIAARREVAFSEEQERLADLVVARGDDLRRAAHLARGRTGVTPLRCPRCGRAMLRRHRDYEPAAEVDVCAVCDLLWFEKDELEVLQILSEHQSA